MRAPLCVLLAFVAGCASNYLDPSLDEAAPAITARLILKSRSGIVSFRAFGESAACAKPQAIAVAMALQAGEDDEADIGVPADGDFSFAARQVVAEGKTGCQALATFRPAAGQRYLAAFTSNGVACSLDVRRIQSAVPPRIVPEPTFRVRRPAAASGASCAAE
ncbi:MAG: hypothetical protein H7Y89_08310 [Steroidobacteraceae bacterium]|nr:hypothetical protein [Steroidobacteraceae bacterium]